ncbi:MAG: S8/S53 family peptidase [Bacteroidota bacterium]
MRIFYFLPFTLLALGLAGCQEKAEDLPVATLAATKGALSTQQLDDYIYAKLRQDNQFEWSQAPDHVIWSALTRSDYVLSVGFQPGDASGNAPLPADLAKNKAWQEAREQVLEMIFEEERKSQPGLSKEKLIVFDENVLPVLDVEVHSLSTVQRLRQSKLVRYAEPMGYEPKGSPSKGANPNGRTESSILQLGCGNNTPNPNIQAGTDYVEINTPDGSRVKSSWNQANNFHGIRTSWTQSTGAGVKIMIIDSGCSDAQENLGNQFNQGQSSGRTIERLVTLPRGSFLGIQGPVETFNDLCGHGTSMAGACAGPRGTDGASVGIAYNSNLITVRAAADVLIDESREVKGVSDAFILAGNRSDVRIISMSMGKLTSSSQMRDAIQYAYARGKLFFCAAGTSLDWIAEFIGVTYPATLAEAVAVTGIKDNLTQRCAECHQGPKVDFTVVMEQSVSNRHVLTLAMSGDAPSTVGGSSVATASMAGMAAIVWSRYPNETREQIMARLVAASSNAGNRHPNLGWGRVNVAAAVGAFVQ